MMLYGYLLVSQLIAAANLLCVLAAKRNVRRVDTAVHEMNEDDE